MANALALADRVEDAVAPCLETHRNVDDVEQLDDIINHMTLLYPLPAELRESVFRQLNDAPSSEIPGAFYYLLAQAYAGNVGVVLEVVSQIRDDARRAEVREMIEDGVVSLAQASCSS